MRKRKEMRRGGEKRRDDEVRRVECGLEKKKRKNEYSCHLIM